MQGLLVHYMVLCMEVQMRRCCACWSALARWRTSLSSLKASKTARRRCLASATGAPLLWRALCCHLFVHSIASRHVDLDTALASGNRVHLYVLPQNTYLKQCGPSKSRERSWHCRLVCNLKLLCGINSRGCGINSRGCGSCMTDSLLQACRQRQEWLRAVQHLEVPCGEHQCHKCEAMTRQGCLC